MLRNAKFIWFLCMRTPDERVREAMAARAKEVIRRQARYCTVDLHDQKHRIVGVNASLEFNA
jgi:hypothetical protein